MSKIYTGEALSQIAFPLGGIGAGMICFSGTGSFIGVSLRNRPSLKFDPNMFSALCVKKPGGANTAKLLEGPVPRSHVFAKNSFDWNSGGIGHIGRNYGLPRFRNAAFTAEFPFASLTLSDEDMPVSVCAEAWSPFIPGDEDSSSLPAAFVKYSFTNTTGEAVEAVYSFHSVNFMKARFKDGSEQDSGTAYVKQEQDGFVLRQPGVENPWDEGAFYAFVQPEESPGLAVDTAWFRGSWFDGLTMLWQEIESGAAVSKAHPIQNTGMGGSLYVPLRLKPGETKTVTLHMTWYVPETDQIYGHIPGTEAMTAEEKSAFLRSQPKHKPWYAGKFGSVYEIHDYVSSHAPQMESDSRLFAKAVANSSLPDVVKEAVTANLSILKSPTVMRQTDGRLWSWEGCRDDAGSCTGSCTHVWNYAQAIPHLFPRLERGLRQTEFFDCQNSDGHQNFRAPLPIRESSHDFHAAADGQLGGIMKLYRDWRLSGDEEFIKRLWPQAVSSLEYCIRTWDPRSEGVLTEPHHNTYDIEFWGPDSMCNTFYLGALLAAQKIAGYLGEKALEERYAGLYSKGRIFLENELYNGEYFIQKIQRTGFQTAPDLRDQAKSEEEQALYRSEGPKYQYGDGCLSDGILGCWLAKVCGLGDILDREKIKSHLLAVHRYNLRHSLSAHCNPQRPGYAYGDEGGLLLCSWPRGGKPTLPFVYSDEVWTGIEYQVASHLIMLGCQDEGIEIVELCRSRYDGAVRNPFNEYECGSFYARAMASYALVQAFSGAVYDGVENKLTIDPAAGDFRSLIGTKTGFACIGLENGKIFFDEMLGSTNVDLLVRE